MTFIHILEQSEWFQLIGQLYRVLELREMLLECNGLLAFTRSYREDPPPT